GRAAPPGRRLGGVLAAADRRVQRRDPGHPAVPRVRLGQGAAAADAGGHPPLLRAVRLPGRAPGGQRDAVGDGGPDPVRPGPGAGGWSPTWRGGSCTGGRPRTSAGRPSPPCRSATPERQAGLARQTVTARCRGKPLWRVTPAAAPAAAPLAPPCTRASLPAL